MTFFSDSYRKAASTILVLTLLLVIVASFSMLVWSRDARSKDGAVEIVPVTTEGEFADAAAPGALNFACAPSSDALKTFFEAEGLPFDPELLREMDGAQCHIFYRPSAPGFRVDPDDFPVDGLVMNVSMLHFLAHREKTLGDTLDITRILTREIERPITFYLAIGRGHEEQRYQEALRFHYPDSIHHFEIIPVDFEGSNPWVQDYLKVGHRGNERMALIPRRIFQGVSENGELYRPALKGLMRDSVVASQLSWEGGDFQFVRLPRDPDKVAMLYGNSAKPYWGSELTQDEYAYVLTREFGADFAVDVSGVEGHVDYFFAFIPQSGIVLVSQPEVGNEDVIRDAAEKVLAEFPPVQDSTPGRDLRKLLDEGFQNHTDAFQAIIDQIRDEAETLAQRINPELEARIIQYIQRTCPESPQQCFSLEGQAMLLKNDRDLFRDWTTAAMEERSRKQLLLAYLAIMESQLHVVPSEILEHREEKKETLRELGFKVVEVPRFGSRPERDLFWPGISYVNGLLVDNKYFVPVFGLGASEDRILEDLRRQLPDSIELVLVPAQHMLLNNGGIHCTTGIVRKLPGS